MNKKKIITKNIIKNRIREVPTEFESLEELDCFCRDSVNLAGLDLIIPTEFNTDELMLDYLEE